MKIETWYILIHRGDNETLHKQPKMITENKMIHDIVHLHR